MIIYMLFFLKDGILFFCFYYLKKVLSFKIPFKFWKQKIIKWNQIL